jgi:hypothetical protein
VKVTPTLQLPAELPVHVVSAASTVKSEFAWPMVRTLAVLYVPLNVTGTAWLVATPTFALGKAACALAPAAPRKRAASAAMLRRAKLLRAEIPDSIVIRELTRRANEPLLLLIKHSVSVKRT